jgi:hypothetical protein
MIPKGALNHAPFFVPILAARMEMMKLGNLSLQFSRAQNNECR